LMKMSATGRRRSPGNQKMIWGDTATGKFQVWHSVLSFFTLFCL
jgi:hypothetical protein